jgi:hypothetical protein
MMPVYGMKVLRLTVGDLLDVRKQGMKHGFNKIYREKSAEIIVPDAPTASGKDRTLRSESK